VAHYFGEAGNGSSKNSSNSVRLGWLSDDSKFRIEGVVHKQNFFTAGTTDDDKTSWLVGAFYNFDFGRVHMAYATSKRKDNLHAGATKENFQEFMTGIANVQVGPGKLMATVIRKQFKNDDPRGLKNRWQWGVNYDYPLSRRTKMMFAVVLNQNKGEAVYAANTNSYAGAPASAGRAGAIHIGLNHSF
jgi:predicted porin